MTYDTGFIRAGAISREHLDPDLVRRELQIIRDDLHCNAVQIIGGDPERLELAACIAADLGLEVWFSPYPLELESGQILALFADCADRAERVRRGGAEVVFVAGVEMSIMNRGFIPGDSVDERLGRLLGRSDRGELITSLRETLDHLLATAVPSIRARFGGRITYASIPFEGIDWARFDIISVELIRNAEVADRYREGVRRLVAGGKPVAITGFGAATYRGAGDRGARAMDIVEYDQRTGAPLRLNGEFERDEADQATYLDEILEILDAEGVDASFVFLFALEGFPHRPGGDPHLDLDVASPAIVSMLEGRLGETYPDLPWEPKAAFTTVAARYAGPSHR